MTRILKSRSLPLSSFYIAAILISMALFSTGEQFIHQTAMAQTTTVEPELPRIFQNTTLVPPTGKTINVPAGGNFQAAIDQAAPGDVITLEAGATYTGNFILKNKTTSTQGSPWIIIRTSVTDANFVPQGTRVGPNNASLMPKIVTPNSTAALRAEAGAHHYRLVGLEVTLTAANNAGFHLVEFDGNAVTVDQLPQNMIVDRCYIHGRLEGIMRRGVVLNCGASAVIDSQISAIKHTDEDSQAIIGWKGPGPFKIVNNYLEGAAENVMFGGGDPVIQNIIPADIEVRNNYFSKPLFWRIEDPTYYGHQWSIKNLLELKNARRVLVDRNLFEHSWVQAQVGFAILLSPRNQDGGAPWSGVQDITITNNVIRSSANGINVAGRDDNFPSTATVRIQIKNNLFYDINGPKWGFSGANRLFQIVAGVTDLAIVHNTANHAGDIVVSDAPEFPNNRFTFQDNITPHGEYGVKGSNAGTGNSTLNLYFPNGIFQKNVIIGGDKDVYPTNNFFIQSLGQVGFVNITANDYRLTNSSPYRNAATDGTDIGCNVDLIFSNNLASSVNAASYRDSLLAPSVIATVFGADLASSTLAATGLPLPTTLAGTTVKVRDSAGVERLAPLFFVSATQVNYLIPAETSAGSATVSVTNQKGIISTGAVRIDTISPGLFTADSSGRGLPTGQLLRIRNNEQIYEPIARFDSTQNKWVAVPIDFGPATDQVFLVLYGTGMRNRSSLAASTATIGGTNVQVAYLGSQGSLSGLDQSNILLSRSLAGRGELPLVLMADGKEANMVLITFK